MDWLFRKTSTNNHVMGYEITQFPIPKLFKSYISILNLFYDLLSHCNRFQVSSKGVFELTLNSFVLNLYFPDHMQEREIDVLQFVERDIEKVMQGREFEKISDTEKEHVIEQLHQTWTHPDSEVRNRIKLFAVRSPEILKPILV